MGKWYVFASLPLLCIVAGSSVQPISTQAEKSNHFKYVVVDSNGPADPWGKSVGDINGDGLPDLIVGGHSPRQLGFYERILRKLRIRKIEWPTNSELVWYENPIWKKHVVSDKDRFRTDHEICDVDRDGRNDLVSLTDTGLVWFQNPDWSRFVIDTIKLHDIEVADFDNDGDIDLVARNQSLFNYGNGNELHFYKQQSPYEWSHFTISIPHGEGLKIADLDGDLKPDVIVNSYWYKNPGILAESEPWQMQSYCPNWDLQDVFIDVGDINADGRQDIVLTPAEIKGERYRIAWFEQPAAAGLQWKEHVIDQDVEAVHHFVAARDLDSDGDIDVLTAEMYQGEDPDEVKIYWNQASGLRWKKGVIATTGSHSMRAADIDNDGDIDFFGANWSGDSHPVELWENQTRPNALKRWRRHVIDSDKPWRSVFIAAADLDRDGYKDVVTGAWWYRNPGVVHGNWLRPTIGEPANNIAVVKDFDADGDPDILASLWKDRRKLNIFQRLLRKLRIQKYDHYPTNGRFVWARNDGKGRFDILDNIAIGEGDFLQGAVAGSFESESEVALSWHKAGYGVQMLQIPKDPVTEKWHWRRIAKISQDEALSAGDIDGDGDLDLLLGTQWLRNDGAKEWTPYTLWATEKKPDRNRLVDINGDGKLDVVIGFEAISVTGKLAWYEQGSDLTKLWAEHPIASVVGPMSLDVADLDKDGDQDIVVGEHNLKDPETARLLLFENTDGTALRWRTHVIYTGDEHHDGAQVVDIDNDGDLDIISIGWGHKRVLLYENQNR